MDKSLPELLKDFATSPALEVYVGGDLMLDNLRLANSGDVTPLQFTMHSLVESGTPFLCASVGTTMIVHGIHRGIQAIRGN